MRKSIIFSVVLMMILSIPTAMAAITVDGYKATGEWNDNWSYGQSHATTYSPNGPFGDRLVLRQGRYSGTYATNIWYDIDPKNDSGITFDSSMAELGESSGSDIANVFARYDFLTDTVYGLVTVYGIPGDHDGNGNAGTASNSGDSAGTPGPAGTGLGEMEYWHLMMVQGGTSTLLDLQDNNWTVSGNGFVYGDVNAKFTSDQSNSVYEISFAGLSNHYTIAPGAVLAMELFAGSSGDTPGEDSAVVFITLPNPKIQIVKYVMGMNGVWYDANNPASGPYMDGGSAVSWKYVITNIGDEPLINVIVTDDQGVSVPDPGTLNIGQNVTYIVQGTVPDTCAPYGNLGSVEGTGLASGFKVTDSDPAYYNCIVYEPAIQIIKYVMGMDGIWYDANTPATGPYMNDGSAVSWKYVITNIGDEALRNVIVTDDQGVSVPDPGNLAIAQTVTYIVDGTVSDPCSPYTNVGKVVGIGVKSGTSVEDADPANYRCPEDVPALTPTGLLGLIGVLGMIGIFGVKRRD